LAKARDGEMAAPAKAERTWRRVIMTASEMTEAATMRMTSW
jgi:hypothetical protein